jgi:hypothetical protein
MEPEQSGSMVEKEFVAGSVRSQDLAEFHRRPQAGDGASKQAFCPLNHPACADGVPLFRIEDLLEA